MKKVLIADDSMFMRKVLEDILPSSCSVVHADCGQNVRKQFREEKPDLVLLDIVMPEGEEEGVRLLQEIKTESPQTVVVMITAVGQARVKDQCERYGADGFIIKPFDEKTVISTIDKLMTGI